MGLLRIKLTDSSVYASYMGGTPAVSTMNDAWIHIIKSLMIGGDVIEVVDERDQSTFHNKDLTFTFDTDTAERTFPNAKEPINPLYDRDALVDWLERNPDELKRISKLINEQVG